MDRTYIKDLKNNIGENVLVKGWAKTIRKQGGITFLIVRDVTGIVQGVVSKGTPEIFNLVNELSTESVISVTATVSDEPQAPGGFELHILSIDVLSTADPELPIPITDEKGNEADITKRLDWRWIDLRDPEKLHIFQVWTELERGFRHYINNNGYVQFYSPSLMTAPSESGSEVFSVNYFDKTAYLAQSPQFYKQMAMASGFEKVFLVGPVFRAEPSFTARHMTECNVG